MKCDYMNMEGKDGIVLEQVGLRKPGLRLPDEFSGRREQLLTNRTMVEIVRARMVLTEQVQLQRYPRDHRHKADSRKYKSVSSNPSTHFSLTESLRCLPSFKHSRGRGPRGGLAGGG